MNSKREHDRLNAIVLGLLAKFFKVVAVGMAALAMILFALKLITPPFYFTVLIISLFCLAISAILDRTKP